MRAMAEPCSLYVLSALRRVNVHQARAHGRRSRPLRLLAAHRVQPLRRHPHAQRDGGRDALWHWRS